MNLLNSGQEHFINNFSNCSIDQSDAMFSENNKRCFRWFHKNSYCDIGVTRQLFHQFCRIKIDPKYVYACTSALSI